MKKVKLSEIVKADIQKVGVSVLKSWFEENGIKIPSKRNFFEGLEKGLGEEKVTTENIITALCELEENGDKKIHLYQSDKIKEKKVGDLLKQLKNAHGMKPIKNYSIRIIARETPTFNYMSFENNIVKIKYSEKHYEIESDYESEKMFRTPKTIYIIIVVNIVDGLVQIRYDNPGMLHKHKNIKGKPTESIYEKYYKDKLEKLFPDVDFADLNLLAVTNEILNNRKIPFRIHRGINTLADGSKQMYSKPDDQDIRDIQEFEAAAQFADEWLTEDLSGYWKFDESKGELRKDLFMRISRRVSIIRVQRGCLEKELNYGIAKIREIQKGV